MKAPAFWDEKPSLLAWLLWPFGWLYGQVTSFRMKQPSRVSESESLTIPVICVGNFTAGGTGKTPTVACIADLLIATGEKPFILSRGYGGSEKGPLLISPALHRSAECGDEPLLLARHAPTIVARDRIVGARFAQASGATVIIMDDGLQNPGLTKDFTIAVVDGGVGIGNGFCIPAGPLRAPISSQASHVNMILWIGGQTDDSKRFMASFQSELPLMQGSLVPAPQAIDALRDRRLLAFAGIGRPQKFFETLRACGLNLNETQSFADHHAYSDQEINALRARASQSGMQLVTTEKDWVRLAGINHDISVVPVRLVTDEVALITLIRDAMQRKRSVIVSREGA